MGKLHKLLSERGITSDELVREAIVDILGRDIASRTELTKADAGAVMHLACGLKPMAKLVGLEPIEVDRERMHLLTDAERQAYVASDAEVTRALIIRRWQTAKASIDQVDHLGPAKPFVPPPALARELHEPATSEPVEHETQPQTIG